MKNILSISLILCLGIQVTIAQDEMTTTDSMESIMEYMSETTKELKKSVMDLSKEQIAFKPADSVWSALGVMEHIILSEGLIFNELKTKLAEPEETDLEAPGMDDDQLINSVTDRSNKIKTFPALEPKGKYSDLDTAWKAFMEQRKAISAYLETLEANLENYRYDVPFGKVDGYQYLKFMVGHTARHTAQIEELKAMDGFPH